MDVTIIGDGQVAWAVETGELMHALEVLGWHRYGRTMVEEPEYDTENPHTDSARAYADLCGELSELMGPTTGHGYDDIRAAYPDAGEMIYSPADGPGMWRLIGEGQ